ncbi:hypothetical protein OJ253_3589 [Cryptosporidium canis]|uniref:Uncharacterized protein n=1 Tax=Cryptosporidium canis TaxID=195482 RepID=A0A9D5DDR8_9CRYT|nr:hypothetical protein OJ253_3589 [Cryptosporidium canis]
MFSETTDSLSSTCMSTPRRSKVFEDETIAFAPDARRAVRKQHHIDLINGSEWHKSSDSKNERDLENLSFQSLSSPLLNALSRSSICSRQLVTPKRGLMRESILSTGTPRGRSFSHCFDLTFDCISVYGNDSDQESNYDKDPSPLKGTKENENVSVENLSIYSNRLISLCKRGRDSLELDVESDSPSELVRIMSKSLRLS